MNPEHPAAIKAGDRVVVRQTVSGYGNLHTGRTGTVQSLGVRTVFDGWDYNPETTYLVQMDAPRPEQVIASRVEKVPASDAIQPGDRVLIKGESLMGRRDVIGKEGIARDVGTTRSGYRNVEVDDLGRTVLIRHGDLVKIEELPLYGPPTAAVGDRVVIVRVPRSGQLDKVGSIGLVSGVKEPRKVGGEIQHRTYDVLVDGVEVTATKVAITPETTSPAPAVAEPLGLDVIQLDARRLQAAAFSHQTLGTGDEVRLDDLIGLAEFVMGERTLGTATTGTVQKTRELTLEASVETAAEPLADWERELLSAGRPSAPMRLTINGPADGPSVEAAPSLHVGGGAWLRVGSRSAHLSKEQARELAATLAAIVDDAA